MCCGNLALQRDANENDLVCVCFIFFIARRACAVMSSRHSNGRVELTAAFSSRRTSQRCTVAVTQQCDAGCVCIHAIWKSASTTQQSLVGSSSMFTIVDICNTLLYRNGRQHNNNKKMLKIVCTCQCCM